VRQGSAWRGRKRGEVHRTRDVCGGEGADFLDDVGKRRVPQGGRAVERDG
jgi:hypothetical protein